MKISKKSSIHSYNFAIRKIVLESFIMVLKAVSTLNNFNIAINRAIHSHLWYPFKLLTNSSEYSFELGHQYFKDLLFGALGVVDYNDKHDSLP